MAYNRWVQGIAARDMGSTPVSLSKLLGLSDEYDQSPNNVKVPKQLHPLLDNTAGIVGNAYLSLSNLKQKIDLLLRSNAIESKEEREKILKIRRQIIRTIIKFKRVVKLLEEL